MSSTRTLLLMRHARPEPPGAGPDHARKLSAEGLAQARRAGERLRSEAPQLLMSSPATRCRQTAEAVVAGLAAPTPPAILLRDALGQDDATAVLAEIEDAAPCLLVVTHQPTLVLLGSALLGGAGPPLDLRPAEIAILLGGPGAWRLREVLEPPHAG